MESKFEKVSLKVKTQLIYGEPFDQWFDGELQSGCWYFDVRGFPCIYDDEDIEKYPERFVVVRKKRKIKSVKMKEVPMIREGNKEIYSSIRTVDEEYILNNPDKFIIEYED